MEPLTFAELMGVDQEVDESFKIDSYEKAEWALEKAGEAQATIEQIQAEAKKMIDRIKEACDERTKGLYQTVERMAYYLDPWARKESEKINKRTINLAMGDVKIIAGREALRVENEQAVIDYLDKAAPDLVRIKKELKKKEIKEAVKGGVLVEGCSVVRGEDRIELKPKLLED